MRSFLLACAIAALPLTAGAFSYNENVDGDLSDDRLAPTALVAAKGSNTLTAGSVGGDVDYVRVSLPAGFALASLVLDAFTSTDDVAFLGLQKGTIFSVTPSNATAGDLLGYTHFGSGPLAGGATVGNDMLDDIAIAQDAQGFLPPLHDDDYTFWIQQLGAVPFGYTLDFVVVPEPAGFGLLGLGLLAIAGARSRLTPGSAAGRGRAGRRAS